MSVNASVLIFLEHLIFFRFSMFVRKERDNHLSYVLEEQFLTKSTECATGGTMSSVRTRQNILT